MKETIIYALNNASPTETIIIWCAIAFLIEVAFSIICGIGSMTFRAMIYYKVFKGMKSKEEWVRELLGVGVKSKK